MPTNYLNKYTLKAFTFLIIGLLFLAFFSTPVNAEGEISLKVDPGFNGEYKMAQWVPIKITITNNSSKDIEGDVVIETQSGYEFAAQYYQPITIAKNSVKETTIIVPGEGIFSRSNVKFVKDGNTVTKTYVGGRSYSAETLFIGVLANDKDTGNFLALAGNKNKGSTRIVNLTADDIAINSNGLTNLDILLINNYSLDGLNEQQLKSIVDWTRQGGSLILAGGANYNKVDKFFSDISPVEYTGITEVDRLTNLEREANKPINLAAPFTLSNGRVKAGDVLIEESGIPLYVLNAVDNGNVLYVAYDIAEEPLASWSGNSEIWGKMLNQIDTSGNQSFQNYNNWWALRNASDKIPALELPELNQLAAFFVFYTIIIGPALYFLLKKRNKHERAWVVIPLLAIILTVGIYQLASFNRGNEVLTHNVSYLELNDGKPASLNTVSAVFVPQAGDYKINYQGDGLVRPLGNYDYYQTQSNALINYKLNETNVTYKDVNYWSLRQSYIQNSIEDAGDIISNLSYQDGKLKGTLTNKTKYNLRDAKVAVGNDVHDIGNLAINQSADIDIPYITTNYNPNSYSYNFEKLLPNDLLQSNRNSFYTLREYNLLEVLNSNIYKYNSSIAGPTLIAWTDDQLIELEVADKKQEDYHITLVKSDLKIMPADNGKVYYPPGTIKGMLMENNANNLQNNPDGYFFSGGSLVFEFKLDIEKLNIDKINFYISSYDNYNFTKKIYNYKTEEYALFDEVMANNQLTGNDADDFISSTGRLKIEISHNENNHYNLQPPAISVEGRMK